MQVTREIPIERPHYEENPERDENSQEFEIRIPKNKPLEEKTKTSNFKYKHKYEIAEILKIPPKVSLSWKKNITSVINWMENHMEAFHEINNIFMVDFINDDWRKWYKVVSQDIFEVGDSENQVEINWKKYYILEHTFTRWEYEMYKSIEQEKKQEDQKEISKKNYKKIFSNISNSIRDIFWDNDKNIK